MTSQSLAGVARVDITPPGPVMQGGYGQRTVPSTGVLDRVEAKALYLAAGEEALLLVTADLISIPRGLARRVQERIGAATRLEARQVCVCASHTHSGPLPADSGGAGVDGYVQQLTDALVNVGLAARDAATPCRIGTGVGQVDLLRNRRTRWEPNEVDPRVPVLTVEDADGGGLSAVVFGVGCHPVTLGWDNLEISGDFPGAAQRRIEARLPGATALFFNSTEGNVIPATSPNLDALDPRGYHGGTYADTELVGNTIGDEVVRVVETIEAGPTLELATARRDLRLPPRNAELDLEAARRRLAAAREVVADALGSDFEARADGHLWALASSHVIDGDLSEDAMRRLMIAVCEILGLSARIERGAVLAPVEVPVQVLRINDLELLALPGEVLVEVGQEWVRRTGNPMSFVVGLANGHLRYLPLAAYFAEPEAHQRYETVTAGLEPSGVEDALDTATALLAELRG